MENSDINNFFSSENLDEAELMDGGGGGGTRQANDVFFSTTTDKNENNVDSPMSSSQMQFTGDGFLKSIEGKSLSKNSSRGGAKYGKKRTSKAGVGKGGKKKELLPQKKSAPENFARAFFFCKC